MSMDKYKLWIPRKTHTPLSHSYQPSQPLPRMLDPVILPDLRLLDRNTVRGLPLKSLYMMCDTHFGAV